MEREKMKAVVCSGYGSTEVLKINRIVKPTPKSNELLIRNLASSVNSGDIIVRALNVSFLLKIFMRTIFGWRKPRNPILGTVYAGIVEEIGEGVKNYKVGDEVFGLLGFKFGGHSEYVLVKENSEIDKKPRNASFEEAAAILFGGQTAYYFLKKTKITMVPNLNVLIYGATGSVGTSALQLAKYFKANVTAVCSDYNEEFVLNLGADRLIFYNQEDVTKNKEKYDVVFDAVGKLSKKQCIHLLKKNGMYLNVKGLTYAKESKEQVTFLKDVFELGNYNATIDKTFLIDEIADAHKYVETGKKKGNVILKIAH